MVSSTIKPSNAPALSRCNTSALMATASHARRLTIGVAKLANASLALQIWSTTSIKSDACVHQVLLTKASIMSVSAAAMTPSGTVWRGLARLAAKIKCLIQRSRPVSAMTRHPISSAIRVA